MDQHFTHENLDKIVDSSHSRCFHSWQGLVQLFWAKKFSGMSRVKQKVLVDSSYSPLTPLIPVLIFSCLFENFSKRTLASIVFTLYQF